MSVRELDGRFKGLVVKRNINQVPFQKHYSFRIKQTKNGNVSWRNASAAERRALAAKAEAYDKKLAAKQAAESDVMQFDPFDGDTNTKIKGIAYRIGKDTQGYAVEAFWLNVSVNGKQFSRSVRLGNRTWKEGWKLIVEKLVAAKNLDPATEKKILAKMPKESDLRTKE